MRSNGTRIVGLVVALGLLALAPQAQAQQSIVAPGTRPMFVELALGPAILITHGGGVGFKLGQEFGYHFSGNSSGPALGASIEESFGSGLFMLALGPKFWWDIQPAAALGLYLTPFAKLGYALLTAGGATGHAFDIDFGFEVKLVLGDRGKVMFRPVGFSILAGGGSGYTGVVATYNLMFGGGVTF